MVSAGWTLVDDQSSGGKYCIYSSTGEDGNARIVYVEINWNTANKIYMYMYLHWNPSTHIGTVKIGNMIYTDLDVYDSSAFGLWVYCSKDSLSLVSRRGTTYSIISMCRFKPFWTTLGKLTSSVNSGSDVVLTLGEKEANTFVYGVEYQIVGATTEGRYNVIVNDINTNTRKITIDSLPVNMGIDSRIGCVPFDWIMVVRNNSFSLLRNFEGVVNQSTILTQNNNILSFQYTDPDSIGNRKYTMWPIIFYDRSVGTLGHIDDYIIRCYFGNTYNDSVGVGNLDEGTAESGGSDTLTDTNKSWTTDEFVGKGIVITSGTGESDVRKITSNNGTQITVDDDFSSTPDGTSEYKIYDEIYRYFIFTSSAYSLAVKEI
jgi:hypothetical protein